MPGLYRDDAVVLRSIKLGEADRIVTLLTKGHGKVRAVVKGVRKTKSRFGARLEPTSHVALQLYPGRELDTVTQAETVESNRALREGYGLFTHAVAMLEAADQVALEREPNPALFRMLTGALRTLAERRTPLVTGAFFWKVLALEGYQPSIDTCVACGAPLVPPAAPAGFDVGQGGVVCRGCARGGARSVSTEAIGVLDRIFTGRLNEVLAEVPGPVGDEVERLGVLALEHHLERRLRSATLL